MVPDEGDGVEKLWAPWRMEYILSSKGGCIFCEKSKESEDEKNYILVRGELCFVMLNAFPYNCGHLMVAPYRHSEQIEELTKEEIEDMARLARECIRALKEAFEPQGFNLGMNLGRESGAGEAHLHLHIVPRWRGDTNFMPVLTDTKVISEALSETYRKLKERM